MKKSLLLLFVFASAFAGGMVSRSYDRPVRAPALPGDAEAGKFAARLLEKSPGTVYDAVYTLKEPASLPADVRVRVFCDALDENNYLACEIRPDRATLFAVESGVRRELADAFAPVGSWPGHLPRQIRLKRRTPDLILVCDGVIVLQAAATGFPGGRLGGGVLKESGIELGDPAVQVIAPVAFLDDFMREAGGQGEWRNHGGAAWEVRSMDNPARSSNAFVYQGQGEKGGLSLVGSGYWDSYRLEASVNGAPGGQIGLALAAAEEGRAEVLPRTYALVRWTARPAGPRPAGGPADPGLELVEVVDGVQRVLASAGRGYLPGQWYRLAATLSGGTVSVTVDDREILRGSSDWFSGGRAGLYVKSAEPSEFDDVRLTGVETAGCADPLAKWRRYACRLTPAGAGLECAPESAGLPGVAVRGGDSWSNHELTVRVQGSARRCGLVAGFRQPGEFLAYLVESERGRATLSRWRGGKEEVLAEGPAPADGKLVLRLERGVAQAGVLAAFVPDLAGGGVGLIAVGAPTAAARFSDFAVAEVDPPRPVASINEIFDDEQLMAIWSGAAGDWRANPTSGSKYDTVYWHRALFFGEREIEARLPAKRPATWEAALSLSKPEKVAPDSRLNGYVLRLAQEKEGVAPVLELLKDGRGVQRRELAEAAPQRLRLRQTAGLLVASVDDRPIFGWTDPEPADGPKIAWAIKGIKVDPAEVQVFCPLVSDYSFNRAPADWRAAGGVWQITNRWECDPRWSFMAGMPPFLARNRIEALQAMGTPDAEWRRLALVEQLKQLPDQESKLAALWHKRSFPGDVTVECFVGQMMDRQRGGGDYSRYVQNLCLTLGGDGRDLESGYSFVFGGWENKKSAILRGRQIVAETSQGIPAGQNIHRKWFRLRARRQGDQVLFGAYTQHSREAEETPLFSLEYRDPQPLKGDRVAVWTYNNGILVARMRLSATAPGENEDPAADYPAEARTFYAEAPQPGK